MKPIHKPLPRVALHLGDDAENIGKNSTYPIKFIEYNKNLIFGISTGEEVILEYNDPKHGFILPPTILLTAIFEDNKLVDVETSPQAKLLNLKDLIILMRKLFQMFESAGWKSKNSTHYAELDTLQELFTDPDYKGGFTIQSWHIGSQEMRMKFERRIRAEKFTELVPEKPELAQDKFLITLSITDYPSLRPKTAEKAQ
jgi:hypothetical protein